MKQKQLLTLKTKQHEKNKQRPALLCDYCRYLNFCSYYSLISKLKTMMNFTIHNAISGVTSNLVYAISHAETCFDNVEDKRKHIQTTLDWLNKDKETKVYEMFEINKCLLIYHELTHTITIKFEL